MDWAAAGPDRPALTRLWDQADIFLLALLGVATVAVDWQIASTWSWPLGWRLAWFGLTAAVVGLGAARPDFREAAAALTVASLYAVPVAGGIIRWHLLPGPRALIGDGAYQTQLAGDVLLRGRDPYGADYGALGLGTTPWGEPFPNPALHHLLYWPGQFLLPLPWQAIQERLVGWWDQRLFLLLAAIAIWLLLRRLLPGLPGRLAVIALFLFPGHTLLAVLGDNDLPVLALLFGALLAAQSRRPLVTGLLLGLAVVTKQQALVAAPFVAAWAAARTPARRDQALAATAAAAIALAVALPFLLWDPAAFFRDTVLFSGAGGIDAYPINGFGLSVILLHTGIIQGSRDAFPFAPIQAAAAIVLWLAGWRALHSHRRAGDVLIWSGLTLAVVLFLGRFFHETHALLGGELVLAGLVANAGRSARQGELDTSSQPRVQYPFAP